VQLTSLTLTTSCLTEPPYVFPGWENVPLDGYPPAKNLTITVERNRTALSDEAEKQDYKHAITAWVIVLIILVVLLAAIGYLAFKGRKELEGKSE
jgi:hypothetical protein